MEKGAALGLEDGEALGVEDGEALGSEDGEALGLEDGEALGLKEGKAVGAEVGCFVGKRKVNVKEEDPGLNVYVKESTLIVAPSIRFGTPVEPQIVTTIWSYTREPTSMDQVAGPATTLSV